MAPPLGCTFSTSFALSRVFIAPHVLPRTLRVVAKPAVIHSRSYAGRPPPTARRLPSDDQIGVPWIHIAKADGTLSEPQRPRAVLHSLDPKVETLQMVSIPDGKSAPGSPTFPVCKILLRKDMIDAEKARKAAKKASGAAAAKVVKTIELNWAIDENDLGHRMKRIKDFLAKGNKVEVAFAGKRKGRKATPEEASHVFSSVRDIVLGEEGKALGWKEGKKPEGAVGGVMLVFLEGKMVEEKKPAKEKKSAGLEKDNEANLEEPKSMAA